jgi:glycosyltransferase involved in cell wall biosynthesis
MGAHIDPDKIRIVRVIGRLNVGGPSIHVVNLHSGLDSSRYEQLLVSGQASPGEGSMLPYAFEHGVCPYVIPEMVTAFSLTARDVKALATLWSVMRYYQPHIVHTHTAKAGFLGRLAARMAGVPIVVHTFHGHVLRGYYRPAKSLLLRRLEQSLAWASDRLVTVSEKVKRELIAFGVADDEKISVIPLGFDLEPFLNCCTERGCFRSELGLTRENKLIGIIGRMFPIKNHHLFLDCAARVLVEEPTARFVIVGDGVLRQALEQQARELGIADRVVFTGWRTDLPRIYADLDLLIVSSDNEGTPVSAIEAMASGCPVVATRVGGLPDLITDYQTGRLVAPQSADLLASATIEMLRRPALAQEIVRNARECARRRFAMKRLIDDVERLYDDLLEKKSLGIAPVRPLVTGG